MNIELGKAPDGGLIIMSDTPLRCNICRVEYHKDRKALTLHYDDPAYESLTSYELSNITSDAIEKQSSVLIVETSPYKKLYGYDVPLSSNDD